MAMRQKESVRQTIKGELIEYGIQIPFGILYSSRKHILKSIDENTTRYQSVFILDGILSPVVGMLLGKQLRRGFSDMTDGIVSRSLKKHTAQAAQQSA